MTHEGIPTPSSTFAEVTSSIDAHRFAIASNTQPDAGGLSALGFHDFKTARLDILRMLAMSVPDEGMSDRFIQQIEDTEPDNFEKARILFDDLLGKMFGKVNNYSLGEVESGSLTLYGILPGLTNGLPNITKLTAELDADQLLFITKTRFWRDETTNDIAGTLEVTAVDEATVQEAIQRLVAINASLDQFDTPPAQEQP